MEKGQSFSEEKKYTELESNQQCSQKPGLSEGDKYVRCKYCDSAFTTDQLKIKIIEKEKDCVHEKARYACPACGYNTDSFIFIED